MKIKKTIILSAALILATGCSSNSAPNALDLEAGLNITREALANSNIKLCATIKDSDQQKDCEMRVNDQEFTNTAVASAKKSDCSKVKDEDSQTRCELLVEDVLDKQNAQDNINKMQAEISQIVENGDIKKCDSIEDENLSFQCRVSIQLQQDAEKSN